MNQDTIPTRSPTELQSVLRAMSGREVLVMVTDNTSTMVSFSAQRHTVVTVRLHRMFLQAPDEVLHDIAHWLTGKRKQRDLVQEYIDTHQHLVNHEESARRPRALTVVGRFFDLLEVRDRVNALYFDNRSTAKVTWGRRGKRGARSFQLGSYNARNHTITISPRLDSRSIPRYMIDYVMFHEMLHEILGVGVRADGRRDVHGGKFRRIEQTYPDYERAKRFEQKMWG